MAYLFMPYLITNIVIVSYLLLSMAYISMPYLITNIVIFKIIVVFIDGQL